MLADLDMEFETSVRRVERLGCTLPGDLALWVPALGLQAIEGDADGDFYQPTDHGELAVIIPVYAGPMPCFMRPVDDAELVDLVAFSFSEPHRWWRRIGLASYLSGHLIQAAVTWHRPLRVLETPFRWLNARGRGVCPLTSDYSALRDPPELRFDDAVFAAHVRRHLTHPFPIPRFSVRTAA